MSKAVFLQVALNGDRVHAAAPRTPEAIAQTSLSVLAAGADSVHVHAFDGAGRETLEGRFCGEVLRSIRGQCAKVPISLTTSASIVSDPAERLCLIEKWDDLPDLVTANQGEAGIIELCELLLSRGVGIEAGLLSTEDAKAFVASGLAGRCRRVLIEPLDLDPVIAVKHAAAMEDVLATAGIQLEQVHHGFGIACWAVNRRALERGHGIRTGFEDVTVLPDGASARDNADLAAAAVRLIHACARPSHE